MPDCLLRDVFEELDETVASDDPEQIVLAAAHSARTAEAGWQSGAMLLLGRRYGEEALETIPPYRGKKPVLDRFGGPDHRTPQIRLRRNGRYEVWIGLATNAEGRDWLLERCSTAAPPAARSHATPPSRRKPFWPEAEAEITAWLDKNGSPQPGDGKQAELERYTADWLATHDHEASESAIRRHVTQCIRDRRGAAQFPSH